MIIERLIFICLGALICWMVIVGIESIKRFPEFKHTGNLGLIIADDLSQLDSVKIKVTEVPQKKSVVIRIIVL